MEKANFPLEAATSAIRERIPALPEVFVVLGSGLSGLAEGVEDAVTIPFSDVPGFPQAGVAGQGLFRLLAENRSLPAFR